MLREDQLKAIETAKRQISEGSLVIWQARLQTVNNSGDLRAVLDALSSPLDRIADDNCGNNCNCGSAMEAALSTNPTLPSAPPAGSRGR